MSPQSTDRAAKAEASVVFTLERGGGGPAGQVALLGLCCQIFRKYKYGGINLGEKIMKEHLKGLDSFI